LIIAAIGLHVAVDRKHAAVLNATGVDRFGDWRRTRKMVVPSMLIAAALAVPSLLRNEAERAVLPAVLIGGTAVVALRASRRGERYEALHGRGPR
jgi:hypothetical protein